MIISFKHKFVFVKTRKVAGTAVEAALRPFLGDDDIVPCVTPRDEYYSLSRGFSSKNWAKNSCDEKKFNELVLKKDFSGAMEVYSSADKDFISHMKALSIRKKMRDLGVSPGEFTWVTIERNPYTYMTSSVRYNNKMYNMEGVSSSFDSDDSAISKKIVSRLKSDWFLKRLNHFMYLDNKGGMLVDRVLKFESIDEELVEFFSEFFGTKDIEMPFLKSSGHREDVQLSFESLSAINEKFSWVFENIGYDYK